MKIASRSALLAIAVLGIALTVLAQTRGTSPFKEMMRRKLDHSQSVLEGIALENFELIGVHAGKLRALSEQPGGVFLTQPSTPSKASFSNEMWMDFQGQLATTIWMPRRLLTQK